MQAYTNAGQWRELDGCQNFISTDATSIKDSRSTLAMSVGQTLTILVVDQPGVFLSVSPAKLVSLHGRVITAVAPGEIIVSINGSKDLCRPQPSAVAVDSCAAAKVTIVGRG